ncbi:hypothetical protein HaLaN_14461 [Haematococcus lacustris]|uniref:Uncharacterized protein n=1 Tax=Haematococcus lacustris TaxID=44745 RepID=A0A699ZFT5_HAELA|nr:hypothetical protein HaLaN_14461 [Haematococcus lacustris]
MAMAPARNANPWASIQRYMVEWDIGVPAAAIPDKQNSFYQEQHSGPPTPLEKRGCPFHAVYFSHIALCVAMAGIASLKPKKLKCFFNAPTPLLMLRLEQPHIS